MAWRYVRVHVVTFSLYIEAGLSIQDAFDILIYTYIDMQSTGWVGNCVVASMVYDRQELARRYAYIYHMSVISSIGVCKKPARVLGLGMSATVAALSVKVLPGPWGEQQDAGGGERKGRQATHSKGGRPGYCALIWLAGWSRRWWWPWGEGGGWTLLNG